MASSLTGLDYPVLQIKTKIVSNHIADAKPVKQEVDSTVILPPLVFPGLTFCFRSRSGDSRSSYYSRSRSRSRSRSYSSRSSSRSSRSRSGSSLSRSRDQCHKTFCARNLRMLVISWTPAAGVFVPGNPFQPNLMFAGNAGAYPSEVPFKCSTPG